MYRVQDKQNAYINEEAVTVFSLYKRVRGAYLHVGKFLAYGHDISDQLCIDTAILVLEDAENSDVNDH